MFPSNKSYFRCKRDALEFPNEDNKEYIVISSSEDEKWALISRDEQ
jgi:hypothetical protein